MRRFRPSLLIAVALVLGLTIGGATVAIAAGSSSTVKVCTTSKGVVRSASASGKCPKKTVKKTISVAGPAGPAGPAGSQGAPGAPGGQGIQGVQGVQGPGSTDFYRAFSGDPGPILIQDVDNVRILVNCNSNGVTSWGFTLANVKIRVSGTTAVAGADPTTVAYTDSLNLPFVANQTSVSASYVVTNMTTQKSFTFTILGTKSGNDCVFSGQITP
jgi:hypothetical protein